ncbi:MAG: sensor domain-containing diguanylate cyclase [Burkholderiales bacterium]|nr:MAG: sensor domain-containing diguanylate cyclase [Burkholderiales bacterium]
MPTSTLIETVADLTAERDRDSLEGSVAQLLRAQLGASSVTYMRLVAGEDGARLWPVLRATADGTQRLRETGDPRLLPAVSGSHARCLDERAALRLSTRDAPRCGYLFPVLSEREPIGLIEAVGVDAMLPPEREAAVANLLRIYRNHLALLDYGEHDTLTSLRNRRTFDADFSRMLREQAVVDAPADVDESRTPAPQDAPHWLAVVDVDRFKRINDEYGHLYGDEVLLLLAQMMRAQFRPIDRLYRFGGEEFVVVLSRTAIDVARSPLERLRASVEARTFSRVGRVTVSIGYTRIGPLDDTAGAFGRADAALYHAKETGRNQVLGWEALVAAGHLAPKSNDAELELF